MERTRAPGSLTAHSEAARGENHAEMLARGQHEAHPMRSRRHIQPEARCGGPRKAFGRGDVAAIYDFRCRVCADS